MTSPNHIVSDARRAATLASVVTDLPHYDRVTIDTDMAGNQTIVYWDKRYTIPVHTEWVPAPPKVNDLAEETTGL